MSDITDKIRAALNYIDADDRSQWVEAALAIKSEQLDDGFEIWDQWSQTSDSYNARSAQSVWRTANSSRISIGTLFWRAQQNGFDLSEFRSDTPVDRAAIEAMAQKQREAREAAEATRLEKQHRAADISAKTLLLAIPAGQDHPYLVRKGLGGDLTPGNLYEIQADMLSKAIGYAPKSDDMPLSGRILVGGVGDLDGVTTLEFIDENGLKSALAGGRKSAAWWAASPLIDNPDQVIVLEGMATAASVAAAEQTSGRNSVVVAALSDTNLPNVAEAMRERYPLSRLVIASDLGNGEKKAFEAAHLTNGLIASPDLNGSSELGTDFNDQHAAFGLDSVQNSIQAAMGLDAFDTQIIQWWRGELKASHILELGQPSPILQQFGIPKEQTIQITQNNLTKAIEKHEINHVQLIGLGGAIQNPLAVFASKRGDDHLVLLTEVVHDHGNIIAALELNRKRDQILVSDIRSLHPKDTERVLFWIEDGLLKGVERNKGHKWLEHSAASNSRQDQVTAALTKVILYDATGNAKQVASLEQATTDRVDISVPTVVQSAQGSEVKVTTESIAVKQFGQQTPERTTVADQPHQEVMDNLSTARSGKDIKRDFRQELTDTLIERLKTGTAPWQKPWVGAPQTPPFNPITGKAYRGANHLWLSMAGFSDPRFATYRQAAAEGWQVRKGEKGLPIEYWKTHAQRTMLDKDGKPVLDENGKPQQQTVKLDRPAGPFHATVFNLSQMDNVPPLPDAPVKFEWDPVIVAESLLKGHQATIVHDQADGAFYRPRTDSIHLPPVDQFPTAADYYGTALHELAHWTGHESRLNRDLTGTFGSESYAREELRAELSSYLLAAEYGIPHNVERHASYVESWIGALSNDKNEIFKASREADSMIDYITAPLRNKEIAQEQTAPPPPEPIESPAPVPAPPPRSETIAQRTAGGVLYPVDSIPTQIKGAVKEHFGARVADYVPRENGGPYKGEVYVAGDYYAQAVSNKSVVYHRKDRVAFPEEFGNPNGKEVSIRYKDGNGQGISFDPARDQLDRAVTTLTRAAQRLGFDGFDQQINKAKNAVWENIQSRRSPAPQETEPQLSRSR